MNALLKTLFVLAIIGAVNWGLVGFLEWNLVQAIFTGDGAEEANTAERVIYALIGVGGLAAVVAVPRVRLLDTRRVETRHGAQTPA